MHITCWFGVTKCVQGNVLDMVVLILRVKSGLCHLHSPVPFIKKKNVNEWKAYDSCLHVSHYECQLFEIERIEYGW